MTTEDKPENNFFKKYLTPEEKQILIAFIDGNGIEGRDLSLWLELTRNWVYTILNKIRKGDDEDVSFKRSWALKIVSNYEAQVAETIRIANQAKQRCNEFRDAVNLPPSDSDNNSISLTQLLPFVNKYSPKKNKDSEGG